MKFYSRDEVLTALCPYEEKCEIDFDDGDWSPYTLSKTCEALYDIVKNAQTVYDHWVECGKPQGPKENMIKLGEALGKLKLGEKEKDE